MLLLLLFVLSCAPPPRPLPTTPESRQCVRDCALIHATCKNGCGFWLLVAWPVIFFCTADCDKDRNNCELTCPDMAPPQLSLRAE